MCDAFYGILVFVLHEILTVVLWNEEFVEFFDEVFMYGPFDFGCDDEQWVYIQTVILDYDYKRVMFLVFVFKGLFAKLIVLKYYHVNPMSWIVMDAEGVMEKELCVGGSLMYTMYVDTLNNTPSYTHVSMYVVCKVHHPGMFS